MKGGMKSHNHDDGPDHWQPAELVAGSYNVSLVAGHLQNFQTYKGVRIRAITPSSVIALALLAPAATVVGNAHWACTH